MNEGDFSPQIHASTSFRDGDTISFVYSPSETSTIDAESQYSHLVGKAYKIVEISSITTRQEYTTSDYNQKPQGFYKNNWSVGAGLIVFGLLLAAGAFVLPGAREEYRASSAASHSRRVQPPLAAVSKSVDTSAEPEETPEAIRASDDQS
jgi:hypothetical protein